MKLFDLSFIVMPAQAGIRLLKKCQTPAYAGVTALCLFLPFQAAHADPYTYAPDGCEFRMTFPGDPYKARKCAAEDPNLCRDVTSYTKVFGIDASINFNVTCNPAEKGMYEQYTGDIMQATLSAMLGGDKLDDYQTGYREYDVAKQAVLLGSGKTGNNERIYIAQLWIGHQSVFTVEAEMIGTQSTEEADAMFADILHSVGHASWTGAKNEAAAPAAPVSAKNAAPQEKKQQK